MQASNTVTNLQGVDRDVAADVAEAATAPPPEPGLTEAISEINAAPAIIADDLEFITRIEWNELHDRIAKFNSGSPHKL